MKAQRRHELQHNVLDTKLAQLGRFLKKNFNTISWVVLIGAIVFLIGAYAWRKHNDSVRQPQAEFENLTAKLNSPGANMDDVLTRLKNLAGQDSNRKIAAAAALAAGANYADQALVARDQITRSQREASAEQMYNDVIKRFQDMPEQVAKAYFGLAGLAESKGDIEKARSNYSQALKLAPNGYPVKEFSSRALTNLDKLKNPVILSATTNPAESAPAPIGLPQPPDSTKALPDQKINQPDNNSTRTRDVPIPRNK